MASDGWTVKNKLKIAHLKYWQADRLCAADSNHMLITRESHPSTVLRSVDLLCVRTRSFDITPRVSPEHGPGTHQYGDRTKPKTGELPHGGWRMAPTESHILQSMQEKRDGYTQGYTQRDVMSNDRVLTHRRSTLLTSQLAGKDNDLEMHANMGGSSSLCRAILTLRRRTQQLFFRVHTQPTPSTPAFAA